MSDDARAMIRDETYYDEDTLFKVRAALLTLLSEDTADACINEMLNAGILFREHGEGDRD